MGNSYRRKDIWGNTYIKHANGSKSYKRKTLSGDTYWQRPDGSKSYKRKTLSGDTYYQHSNGSKSYVRKTITGDRYVQHPDGSRVRKKTGFFGDTTYVRTGGTSNREGTPRSNAGRRSFGSGGSATATWSGGGGSTSAGGAHTRGVAGSSGAVWGIVGVLMVIGVVVAALASRGSSSSGSATTRPPTVATLAKPAALEPARGQWGDWPTRSKPEIVKGSSGDIVRYLQGVLRFKANQLDVAIDGRFGPATEEAVRNVQLLTGLVADGRVGPKTWAVIDLLALNGNPGLTPAGAATPTTAPATTSLSEGWREWRNLAKAEITVGDEGGIVRYLQQVLIAKAGQTNVVADGVFTDETERAVRNVQQLAGITVDGRVGPKTWAVIDALAGA